MNNLSNFPPVNVTKVGYEEIQVVDARTLHDFLGVGKKFADWIKDKVADFEEGTDFMIASQKREAKKGGQNAVEYILTIDMAKHICMLERNEKGKQVRRYFLEVEKKYKSIVTQIKTPQTYLEALKATVLAQEQLESTQGLLSEARETIQNLTHSGKIYTTTEIAKELGMRSASQLNIDLEAREIQYKSNGTWVLRSWYADKGYESIKQMVLENGKVIYDRKWTEAGRHFILKKYQKFLQVI